MCQISECFESVIVQRYDTHDTFDSLYNVPLFSSVATSPLLRLIPGISPLLFWQLLIAEKEAKVA